MLYLVAKGLRSEDFCAFMNISQARAHQLLRWYPGKSFNWSDKTKKKVLEATNNGLDVDADMWEQLEKIFDKLPAPIINKKILDAAKKTLGIQ